jgi:hypothetical protein
VEAGGGNDFPEDLLEGDSFLIHELGYESDSNLSQSNLTKQLVLKVLKDSKLKFFENDNWHAPE